MPSLKIMSGALTITLATTIIAQGCSTCQSFGVDFQSGGSYFQNVLSTDPFTAVQEFEGCSNDTSHNILVDPNGDQYECSMTPMQPDDTPETLSCPLNKDQLYTGDWSLLIISNNGDCDPIDYQRDFSLSVGPQQTVTVAPTVTVSSILTPVESDTTTVSSTITSTGRATTTTVPRVNLNPTITINPLPAIQVITKAILTLTSTSQVPNIIGTATAEATASCQLPQRRWRPDPIASIVATILGDLGLKERDAIPEPTARPRSASSEYKRAILEGRAVEPKVKAQWLAERSEDLALQKRAPDEPIITETDDLPVSTTAYVSTASTTTVTGTTTRILTTTVTPTVTVSKGIAMSVATITAAKKTITNTFLIPVTQVYIRRTTDLTLTITTTTTPASVVASCSSAGGILS